MLPIIPLITEIKEQYKSDYDWTLSVYRCMTLICPDMSAGRSKRYTVVRIDRYRHQITLIGLELDIYTARAVARRPSSRDTASLTPEESKRGRWTKERFLDYQWRQLHRRK